MLKTAYRTSGLTIADLSAATGLGIATIHIALNGFRYRNGQPKAVVPPDRTLVKLSSTLRIHPDVLRAHDRGRAADLLAEVVAETPRATFASDAEAQAAVAGRSALVRQMLALFSVDELRAELESRERAEHHEIDREAKAELIADLKADLGVL